MADTMTAPDAISYLIETAQDGADGYRAASEDVKDAQLKQIFSQYATQRAQFVTELRNLASTAGGDADKGGSVSAAVHRGWINLKSVVTGRDDASILAECERGDENAVKAYDQAGAAPLPAQAATVVQRQAAEVRQAYERIKSLHTSRSAD
ncbi:chemotaxis protein [Gemmatimonadetes bacterium T265]|nr:chemotaxis protein [Gemmatimonadetes bacterium T265]